MAINKNIFCSRKGGATIEGKFHPLPTTSEFIAKQLEGQYLKTLRKDGITVHGMPMRRGVMK